MGVSWFFLTRLLRSGAPLGSMGSFGFVWFVWFVQGVAGFVQVRLWMGLERRLVDRSASFGAASGSMGLVGFVWFVRERHRERCFYWSVWFI